MSDFTTAFDELRAVYLATTSMTPTMAIGVDAAVPIIPGLDQVDPMFFAAGTGDSGVLTIQAKVSSFTAAPTKRAPAVISGLIPTPFTKMVLDFSQANGIYVINIGDISAGGV